MKMLTTAWTEMPPPPLTILENCGGNTSSKLFKTNQTDGIKKVCFIISYLMMKHEARHSYTKQTGCLCYTNGVVNASTPICGTVRPTMFAEWAALPATRLHGRVTQGGVVFC